MIKNLCSIVLASVAVSCSAALTPNYDVKVIYTPDEEGLMLYMVNYDNGTKIDSTLIDESGVAMFNGNVDIPLMVSLVLDGARQGQFILEPGSIEVNPQARSTVSTGELYGRLQDFNARQAEIIREYNMLPNDSTSTEKKTALEKRFMELNDSVASANKDNVIGLSLFLQNAYDMSLDELDKTLSENPYFANSTRVGKLREALIKKSETSEGAMYKDFEVTYNGETKRLSDYVGKGHYTLVDFWASWCGPCIRETKVIKEIYNKYNGKGLEILGVAVWDDPEKTLGAITQHQLPWKQIINAQAIPTDIYGISGIPCIILFDPEGRIVSRDKQDDALKADVDAAMQNYTTILPGDPSVEEKK